jgi:hypothetical protein
MKASLTLFVPSAWEERIAVVPLRWRWRATGGCYFR